MNYKCKKSLYKSTYGNCAFIKGKTYSCEKQDERFLYFIDEMDQMFNFSKKTEWPFYSFEEYFCEIPNILKVKSYKQQTTKKQKMKKFKHHLTNTIELLVALIVPYLIISFWNVNLNAFEWGGGSRFIFSIWTIAMCLFAYMGWNDVDVRKKKEEEKEV